MITQSPYPFDPRVRRQAEKLAREGYEVDILCIPLKDEPEVEEFNNGITAYRLLKNTGQESVTKYIWLSLKFFLLAFIRLNKLNRSRKYILIQVHNMPEVHVFTSILQKIKGVPVVLDIHDLTPELLTSKWSNNLSRFIKPLMIFLEKISCRFSDHVITVTEGCSRILSSRSVPDEKITLIMNTADISIFPFYSEREFRKITEGAEILYHGTVAERFGLHIVIEAMPIVLQKIPGSTLKVYGKYDTGYKTKLMERINQLELTDNIILEEGKSHEELYEIMKDSDMEVVPYLSNEYMNLSLSTKAFECAAAGLPIIATSLETMRMTFNDDSILYAEDSNPRDFAQKIIDLCLNPEQRKRLTINAYYALTGISGDVMKEKYLSLIENISGVKRITIPDNQIEDLQPETNTTRHFEE
jgi:glycosyltransferase involved in cell wall biosynthesis